MTPLKDWRIVKFFVSIKDWKIVKFFLTAWGKLLAILGIVTLLIGAYYSFFQVKGDVDKSYLDGRKFRILVPLQSNTSEYLDFVQPYSKSDVDDMNNLNFDSKVSRNIRDTINATKNSWFSRTDKILTKDKVDFYFFPEGYDEKSYKSAFEKALVIAEKDNREIVALIGNVSSTSTAEYAKLSGKQTVEVSDENREKLESLKHTRFGWILSWSYFFTRWGNKDFHSIKSKIPMILPLATATSLTNNLRVEGVPSFLRLPPDNNKQATFIAKVLLESKPNSLKSIIVKDLTNKKYSEDLVESFRLKYVQDPLKTFEDDREKYPSIAGNFGRILAVTSIGGEFSSPFLYPSITSLQPDALVIFGMTNGSLETLAQAKASNLKFKYIILTDGAVDEYLITRIITLVDQDQINSIRLSFPLPCSLPKELEEILSNIDKPNKDSKLNLKDFDMTHSMFVSDSLFSLLTILENGLKDTNQKDNDADKIVTDTINKWKSEAKGGEKAIEVLFPEFSQGVKRSYKIDQLGNTTNLEYHLFRIETTEVNGVKTPRWKHDEFCPHSKEPKWQVTCEENK